MEEEIKPEVISENDGVPFNDKLTLKCQQLLVSSQMYKQPRMNTLAVYERLYNNDVLPKLRQMFNAVLPIFSGMIDELLAMFNDQLQLKFGVHNPKQELVVPKIQSHWNAERDSLAPNARWDYKARSDRFNAVISGRGILKEYAYNDPEYKNVVEVINYTDFHCDPLGGGLLDNHSFKGTEANFKTLYELENNDKYNKDQVAKLKTHAWTDEMFVQLDSTYGTKFSRWRALGLDPETNTFSGEAKYNLCDFLVKEDGIWYNVVFEPCTGIWVYIEEWSKQSPSEQSCYLSWATHEDDKNFWSKSYADDFFTVADVVITLTNQELTNREKKNFNARAFDKHMFTDVAKLDAAQYRPDALVPADTMGGTKQIANGIYAFETPDLKGTVDLVNWLSSYTGQKTGADELPAGSEKNKAKIVMLQQQKQSKRVGLRSDSFQECYAQLGQIFLEGLREYMPPTLSIQIIGENGFVEESELKKIDVISAGKISISVTSSSEQEGGDAMKKQGQVQAIEMVAKNPTLTRYEKETIYRNIGQFDESEIIFLLDTQGSLSRKQFAHASEAIQDILLGNKVDIYYGADIAYVKYIKQYLVDHKNKIRGKEQQFMDFLDVLEPIVKANSEEQAATAPIPPQEKDASGGKPQPQQKPMPQKASIPGQPTPDMAMAQ